MRNLVLIFTIVAGIIIGIASPAHPLTTEKIRTLVGEDYRYSIDFLLFDNLADGGLRLVAEPQPGRYRAELVGRTLGVAAWLTGERTQRYTAIMEEAEDGVLRSVVYESAILKRKDGELSNRSKRYRFDYQAGKVYLDKGVDGNFKMVEEYPLPPGQTPVDILTGFYNLRAGVYGPLVPGSRLQIPTFTTKGVSIISVEVLEKPAPATQAFFPADGTLLRIKVDPEVFDTGDAHLYAWLDPSGRPTRGIVENVIGMGDVYGNLDQH